MDARGVCDRILACDNRIKDVYIVDSDAHLTAFKGNGDMSAIGEARLAEIIEDFLFIVGSRKHHEDIFGILEYIHITHKNSETFLFPFEKDKVLCVCLKNKDFAEKEIVSKVRHGVMDVRQLA